MKNVDRSEPPIKAEMSPAVDRPECFVIMPVSDPDGYEAGHFQHVFEDIFRPACEMSGYNAIRADHVHETNLIQLDILNRLLRSPMVLCDLSSRNPNVLFELGLRQAFDRPVVLVQEIGTPKIFDIAPLRYTEYRRARVYHEVLQDQQKIAQALEATRAAFEKGDGINSIVRFLSITNPAALPEVKEADRDPLLQLVLAELNELRREIRRTQQPVPEVGAGFSKEHFAAAIGVLEDNLEVMKASGVISDDFERHLKAVRYVLSGSDLQPEVMRNLRRRLISLERHFADLSAAHDKGA